ncbi:MAG: hypothetical protein M3N47_08490 [Chloroflexota bacterium]|nr:hypothetical protein [Chloroflexota bacterium]
MFRFLPWPFPDDQFPQQLGATVMRSVLEHRHPALQVLHSPENDWAIADGVGDPNEAGATTAAHIWHVLSS